MRDTSFPKLDGKLNGKNWLRLHAFVFLAAGLLVAQACSSQAPTSSPDQPVMETAVSLPTDTAPAAIPVSFENIAFVIPSGLGTGADAEIVPAVIDKQPSWATVPAYKKIMLAGYPVQRAILQPHILVYPAQELERVNPLAGDFLDQLRTALGKPGVLRNDDIPQVPMFHAAKVFGSQIRKLDTKNGSGIRMLTSYSQDFSPITNEELIYQFQGFTSDGTYYILVSLPVHAPVLIADEKPKTVLPEGGIPFPDLTKASEADVYAYDQAVADKMNETSPDAFQPTLEQLDALVQSITVTP